jgi:hypothetical protein
MNEGFPNAAQPNDATSPIYFFHIPKTGGTTFQRFLSSNFRDEAICPAHLWHQLIALNPEQMDHYEFIWGHFYGCLHRYTSRSIRYLTMVREPIERALSHYSHIMRDPGHYLHARAKQLGDFGSFLRDTEMATTLTNFQVRSLTSDFDPFAIAASLSPEQIANLEIERAIEVAMPSRPDRELLEQAKQRLLQMCFVGVTERMADSVSHVCSKFAWTPPSALESLNLSEGRIQSSQLPGRDLDLLAELNQEDVSLYAFANELLDRQQLTHALTPLS